MSGKKPYKIYALTGVFLVLVSMVIGAALYWKGNSSGQSYIEISGIAAGDDVHVVLNEWIKDDQGEPVTKVREFSLPGNAQGTVLLPPLAQNIDSYQIGFRGQDGQYKTLAYTVNHADGLVQARGQGFSDNEVFQLSKYDEVYRSRVDWSGSFTRDIAVNQKDFNTNAQLRFAFMGHMAPDDMGRSGNPNIIKVVVAVGGGPTNAQVNIYNPPIGTCSTVNNKSIFPTSTCDVDRMNKHIAGDGSCRKDTNNDISKCTIAETYVVALMLMGEQLSAVMMQQMEIIGQFFDAKEQEDTQRDFRRLVAEAHKDYHPSKQMCEYGSFSKSLSHTEESAAENKGALNGIMMTYYRQMADSSSAAPGVDVDNRIKQFKDVYCNPNDFNGSLWLMCKGKHYDADKVPTPSGSAEERERYNKDIEYYRTLGQKLTMKVNFTDSEKTEEEEDVVALAKNLYWPAVYSPGMMGERGSDSEDSIIASAQEELAETRSIIAKIGVAQNSFTNIVGMKSESQKPSQAGASGAAYMKAMLKELGGDFSNKNNNTNADDNIHRFLGDNPSYYAQMEVLTKLMYQNPNFYTELYDKPVNVDRMNAVMQAIQLMQERDSHESLMRQEMLISQLVEQRLRREQDDVSQRILDLAKKYYPPKSSGY